MSGSDEASLAVDGAIEWRGEEGELHRVGGPARIFPSVREEWFRHGRLYRGDGPAVRSVPRPSPAFRHSSAG